MNFDPAIGATAAMATAGFGLSGFEKSLDFLRQEVVMGEENCQEVGCPNCENFNSLVQIIKKTHRRAVEWCGEESDRIKTCRLDEEKTGPLRYECLECGYMFVNDPKYEDHDEEDEILVRDYEVQND